MQTQNETKTHSRKDSWVNELAGTYCSRPGLLIKLSDTPQDHNVANSLKKESNDIRYIAIVVKPQKCPTKDLHSNILIHWPLCPKYDRGHERREKR